jgi:hypothetical protein
MQFPDPYDLPSTGHYLLTDQRTEIKNFFRFKALTAVKMVTVVFWVMTQCRVVDVYKRFRGT